MMHVVLIHSIDEHFYIGYRDPVQSCGYFDSYWYPLGYKHRLMNTLDHLDERNWDLANQGNFFLANGDWDGGFKMYGEVFWPEEKYFDKIVNTR